MMKLIVITLMILIPTTFLVLPLYFIWRIPKNGQENEKKKEFVYFVVGSFLGLLTWILAPRGLDDRLLPIVCIFSGVLGFLHPKRQWLKGISVLSVYPLVILVPVFSGSPKASNIWPIALVAMAIMVIPTTITAYIGSFFRAISIKWIVRSKKVDQ